MSALSLGYVDWSCNTDKEGHREYTLVSKVLTTDAGDGPYTVMNASGLPTIGSPWNFFNDADPYAYCWPEMSARPMIKEERNRHWLVTQKFSTRPIKRCQDTPIEDPLAEPDRISGSFLKYQKPVEKDRNGKAIKSSSHEVISGLEKDDTRATVSIEQNVGTLDLETFTEMMNTLNDATLWGLDARKIKLSSVSWSRQRFGICSFYYTRRFEFEIRFNGFDEADVVDTGFKRYNWEKYGEVANDHPNRKDPTKFCVAKDDNEENEPKRILLNGYGDPLTDGDTPHLIAPIELYDESDFLLLGIPTTFS